VSVLSCNVATRDERLGSAPYSVAMTDTVYPMYIAGNPVTSDQHDDVLDKHTGQVHARISRANDTHVESAIRAAEQAAEPMRKLHDNQRRDILLDLYQQAEQRFDELVEILIVEAGKTISDAKVEVIRCLDTLRVAAEQATRLTGEYLPLEISDRGHHCRAVTKRVPIGPCSFITPFNFPLNLPLHKIAPAIAAGNPFVMKPAPATPISASVLGEMLSGTDLPPGAFSIFHADVEQAKPLVEDDRLKLLSFTGSAKVGWQLKQQAGRKRIILELGGNAACIVDRDADIEHTADRITFGGFYQAGQSCISVQRVLIHDSLYHDLTARLIEKANAIQPGDPRDDDTFLCPLINDDAAQRIDEWLDEATTGGAKVLCGGRRDGRMMRPTILSDVPEDVRLYREEVFGPVMLVVPFDDFADACRLSNDSIYGLQTGVFTHDLDNAFHAFDELQVGGVIINDVPAMRVDSMPYGGVRQSGLGREGLRWSIEEMTELRTMVLKNIGRA